MEKAELAQKLEFDGKYRGVSIEELKGASPSDVSSFQS
jgi:hypothetical protein